MASGALRKGTVKSDIPRRFTMLMSGTNTNTQRAHLTFWRLSLVKSIQSFCVDLDEYLLEEKWRAAKL